MRHRCYKDFYSTNSFLKNYYLASCSENSSYWGSGNSADFGSGLIGCDLGYVIEHLWVSDLLSKENKID